MKKPKVLIVDDDTSLLNLYTKALEARGLRVFGAKNAEEGLREIDHEKPDLVIADVMMPQVHGLHFLDIIKATPETKHQKVMILTALDDAGTKEQAYKRGALDYLVKSQVSMAEVLEKITGAIT